MEEADSTKSLCYSQFPREACSCAKKKKKKKERKNKVLKRKDPACHKTWRSKKKKKEKKNTKAEISMMLV